MAWDDDGCGDGSCLIAFSFSLICAREGKRSKRLKISLTWDAILYLTHLLTPFTYPITAHPPSEVYHYVRKASLDVRPGSDIMEKSTDLTSRHIISYPVHDPHDQKMGRRHALLFHIRRNKQAHHVPIKQRIRKLMYHQVQGSSSAL